eukprot:TRINITY_DN837_c0_g1_i2.p2 TRINITY_DN837_c0_g1~~TRINITY_DN837_c0_g1_i2.p2  ORF type:complete len:156 (-),score=49.84 TRINITY_DN837_c0_g1_i2:74-541(-)
MLKTVDGSAFEYQEGPPEDDGDEEEQAEEEAEDEEVPEDAEYTSYVGTMTSKSTKDTWEISIDIVIAEDGSVLGTGEDEDGTSFKWSGTLAGKSAGFVQTYNDGRVYEYNGRIKRDTIRGKWFTTDAEGTEDGGKFSVTLSAGDDEEEAEGEAED